MASKGSHTQGGTSTCFILVSSHEVRRHGQEFVKAASRAVLTVGYNYAEYIDEGDESGVLPREKLEPTIFFLKYTQGMQGRRYGDGAAFMNDRSLTVVHQHVGYVMGGNETSRDIVDEVQRAVATRPGGESTLTQVDALVSTLENYFLVHLKAQALNRYNDGR